MFLLLQGPPGYRRSSAKEILTGLGFTVKTEDCPTNRFGEISLQILEGKKNPLQINFYGQGPIQIREAISAHITWQDIELPLFTPFIEKLPYPHCLPSFRLEHYKGEVPAVYLVSQNHYLVPADIFGEAGALLFLVGCEKWSKDRHQRLPDKAHLPLRLGFTEKAVVNRIAQFILELLSTLCTRHGIILPRLLPWPYSAPMAGAITFDLDLFRSYQRLSSFIEPLYHLYRRNFKEIPKSLSSFLAPLSAENKAHFNFESIFSSLSEIGARATFFLASAHAGRRHPLDPDYHLDEPVARRAIMAFKKNRGEIALHSGYQALYDENKLNAQKNYLQEVTGRQVHGNRTHYLRLNYPQSFHLLTQESFDYDSSLGFSTAASFRTGYCLPYHPLPTETDQQLLEMAPIAMDTALFHHLKLKGEQARALVNRLTEEVKRYSGLGVYIFHDFYFSGEFPEMQTTFQHTISKLNRLGAWLVPLEEINNWWRKRTGVTLKATRKKRGWEVTVIPKESVDGLGLVLLGKPRGRVTGNIGNERFSQRYSADNPILLPPLGPDRTAILRLEEY